MTAQQEKEELRLRERTASKLRRRLIRQVRFANHVLRSEWSFVIFCREKDEECGGTFPVCTGGV